MLEAAILCLAVNIFHEARGEPIPGQYAVAQVTMNRAKGQLDRVCHEVYRPWQFSWTMTKARNVRPERLEPDAWDKALVIARMVATGAIQKDFSGGATHYHAVTVNPYWAKFKVQTVQIGRHIFYVKG